MTFWETSTTKQKMAQVLGGLECGMTANQIAMCLGAPIWAASRTSAVQNFMNYHGLSADANAGRDKTARVQKAIWEKKKLDQKADELGGYSETPEAFDIFGANKVTPFDDPWELAQ